MSEDRQMERRASEQPPPDNSTKLGGTGACDDSPGGDAAQGVPNVCNGGWDRCLTVHDVSYMVTFTATFTEADRQRWAEYERQDECAARRRREAQGFVVRLMTTSICELLGRLACRVLRGHRFKWSHDAEGVSWDRCSRCRRWRRLPLAEGGGE